jgi:hypothetical protein
VSVTSLPGIEDVEAISHRRSSIFTLIVQRGLRRLGALDPVATRFGQTIQVPPMK